MKIITDDIDLLQFMGKQESQFIASPSEFHADVMARINGTEEVRGDLLPWNKTHKYVRLRPGELSIWAGINGHGKSQMLGQVCAWNLHKRWLIASMEMKPAATMHRMVRQAAGCAQPSESYVKQFLTSTDNRLWIYDQNDTVPAERILGLVHYASQMLHVEHIVIDSLMKCGLGEDDYNGQKSFVDKLCWAAKTLNVHIHLVHHIRKGDKEGNVPDKFDVKGAGAITDLADNVFIVHRNKIKEERIEAGSDVDQGEPDAILKVGKQRHGEWEGKFALWFHKESMQYIPSPGGRPMYFRHPGEAEGSNAGNDGLRGIA